MLLLLLMMMMMMEVHGGPVKRYHTIYLAITNRYNFSVVSLANKMSDAFVLELPVSPEIHAHTHNLVKIFCYNFT